MHHLAILTKGYDEKIAQGIKIIESRFYRSKQAPWDKVSPGDTIFFKVSGGPVALRAEVEWVKQFSDLTPVKIQEIVNKYGDEIAAKPEYWTIKHDSKYAILIKLKNVGYINNFLVGRSYGSAWVTVDNIDKLKI